MIKSIKSLKTFNKSEDELKKPDNLNFKMKIGTTTYMVNAHFNKDASGDMVSRIKSLMTR